ncbi:NADH-quinone oxidoreductase subunit N [Psychrobacter sp. FDAARGOS_221]|uniref:NADH-quinone oxidoreductase subunit N n=1 Tax=Psychrobacter sp. FDAARGOS_221 TaxID=1975705 RepID=UPI000BB55708|nr:NADH-quinone oxidoreductase subunit N [Psychrobacter sp. FDAARGOS_221]PNK60032.1 NADH-quinone oxidoreductase subunit N [Psychrobacter sp. FDAARGOS_221]
MNNLIANAWSVMQPFAPIIVVVVTLLVVMLGIALKRSHFLIGTLSVMGLNIALLLLIGQIMGWVAMPEQPVISAMFIIDPFAQFNMAVILVAALACCTLAYPYFRTFKDHKEELYLLLLLSTVGALLMVSAHNLASFFMSLELLSVPLYGMLAYAFMRNRSLESGLKYLVLSATASATLLMGMAFIYAATGTLQFKEIALSLPNVYQSPLMILGAAMMTFAVAFKLSAAPFHIWTADVYQGAPAPVATYLASVTKVAMMALAIRFLIDAAILAIPAVQMVLMVVATLSILFGNLLALRQTNLKRLLGYSSIAHMGYVMVAALSVASGAYAITNMYMAVYALTSVGLFGVLTLMSSSYKEEGEAAELYHYRGLFWRRPVLTGVMTVMLLSMAGIPLTAGFITKFFAIVAAVDGRQWWLAAMIIVGSAIGLFYYLRVMLTLFKRPNRTMEFDALWHWGIQVGGLMVILVTLLVIYVGVLPNNFILWATQSIMW